MWWASSMPASSTLLHCTITLAEFRTLDRFVTFLGSFDENEQKRLDLLSRQSAVRTPL